MIPLFVLSEIKQALDILPEYITDVVIYHGPADDRQRLNFHWTDDQWQLVA